MCTWYSVRTSRQYSVHMVQCTHDVVTVQCAHGTVYTYDIMTVQCTHMTSMTVECAHGTVYVGVYIFCNNIHTSSCSWYSSVNSCIVSSCLRYPIYLRATILAVVRWQSSVVIPSHTWLLGAKYTHDIGLRRTRPALSTQQMSHCVWGLSRRGILRYSQVRPVA